MHTPELGQKLKHLEKLLKEAESLAKRYLSLTGRCSTELDDEDRVVIPFDEQLYTKLMKMYNEALTTLIKDEAAIDACLEKVTEMQRHGGSHAPNVNATSGTGSGKGLSNINPNNSANINNLNMNNNINNNNNLNTSSSGINNLANITPKMPVEAGMNVTKRKLKDPESPAKKQKRPKKGTPSGITPSPSPTSPNVPTYIASVGDLAAARAPNSDQWILVRITSYNVKTGRYEVEDDAPDEEETVAKKFVCSTENIVLLPPDSASIPPNANPPPNNMALVGPTIYLWYPIPPKTSVLAMFPQTTTFYPAKVVGNHKKNKIVQFYQLQFDDDQEGGFTPSRKVNAQYVIPLPRDF